MFPKCVNCLRTGGGRSFQHFVAANLKDPRNAAVRYFMITPNSKHARCSLRLNFILRTACWFKNGDLEIYDAVVDVRCYELTALFLCSLFVPKCGPLGHMVRPCRSLCQETMRRCGFFLEVFGLSMPDYLQCEIFPESTDTDVCLGNREVKEARLRAAKPVCPTGFQCDVKRCIPHDWRCDGHVDCADRSDELNCRVCKRSGDVHCGNQRCISQAHMCDGRVDCPWGQDERNCSHRVHHPRSSTMRLYIPRKCGGRGFLNAKTLHNREINNLREHFLNVDMGIHRDAVAVDNGLTPLSLAKENWRRPVVLSTFGVAWQILPGSPWA
ncbi:hypothetical protein evm_014416 [Chilo suppressalis]|nr:hypothetical protein evm_014416 [Chilo suppressalis]